MNPFIEQTEAMSRTMIDILVLTALDCLATNGRLAMGFLEFVPSRRTVVRYQDKVTILTGRVDYTLVTTPQTVPKAAESAYQLSTVSFNITHSK